MLFALDFTLGLGFRFPSERIIGWAWLGLIVLGIVCGHVQSRRQNGFASASRRAAAFGLVIGLFGGVLLAVVWMLCLQRTTQAALPWVPACVLIAFISLTGACVAATRHGEQRHSQGFDVLTPLPREQE